MTTEVKKRGRRKKVITNNELENKEKEEIVVKRGKKNVKIVSALAITESIQARNINVILHLKCSLKQIDEYLYTNLLKNGNLTYFPEIPKEIEAYDDKQSTYSLINEEVNKPAYQSVSKHLVCPKCNYNNDNVVEKDTVNPDNLNMKLKDLKLDFYKNNCGDKKAACFWCTYPFDCDTCYILKHGSMGEILGNGSFCSPECSVAYLFNNLNWDDSVKIESYQLINYYYGKPNNFEDNIKPASSPFYFLDKYYGNMDIHEYRKLSKSNHMLLTVEKPVTRVLPEIHEDSDKYTITNTQMRGNYKVKKQSDKCSVQNRNSILRDSFGLA